MLSRTSLAVYSKLKHIDSSVAAPVNVYDSSSPGVKSPLSFHSTGDTAHCNISWGVVIRYTAYAPFAERGACVSDE